MRLCKDCKHIYEEKEQVCPKCKSENTVELVGPGIKADHENVHFHWLAIAWLMLCFVAMIAFGMYLIGEAGVADTAVVSFERTLPKKEAQRTVEQIAELTALRRDGNLLMVGFMVSALTGVMYALMPKRKSRKLYFVILGMSVLCAALCLGGQLGARSVLPLALLPVTLLCLLPHWDKLR